MSTIARDQKLAGLVRVHRPAELRSKLLLASAFCSRLPHCFVDQKVFEKGRWNYATSPSTGHGTGMPRAGYRPPVVTAPSIAPADPDYVEPFVFKSILHYDAKLGKRGEEDSPD